ncbi:MAG: hypothetical protein FJX46_05260 [Alphaproteobacteria bacterium]|nr:hypothetical protein [Alphaproteobacteria bacterium]
MKALMSAILIVAVVALGLPPTQALSVGTNPDLTAACDEIRADCCDPGSNAGDCGLDVACMTVCGVSIAGSMPDAIALLARRASDVRNDLTAARLATRPAVPPFRPPRATLLG